MRCGPLLRQGWQGVTHRQAGVVLVHALRQRLKASRAPVRPGVRVVVRAGVQWVSLDADPHRASGVHRALTMALAEVREARGVRLASVVRLTVAQTHQHPRVHALRARRASRCGQAPEAPALFGARGRVLGPGKAHLYYIDPVPTHDRQLSPANSRQEGQLPRGRQRRLQIGLLEISSFAPRVRHDFAPSLSH